MMGRVQTRNSREIPVGAKNGICLPVLRVDNMDYDLEQLERAELIELRALLEADIANIEYQRESGHNGAWADPSWEAKALYARRMKQSQVNLIQAELGRRKETTPSLHKFFMDEAWRVLDEKVFKPILEVARGQHEQALAGV